MSTNYYLPRPGITDVKISKVHDDLWDIDIYENGARAGELTLSEDLAYYVLRSLFEDRYLGQPDAHSSFGGKGVGLVVTETNATSRMPDSQIVCGEGMEVITLGELRKMRGSGK